MYLNKAIIIGNLTRDPEERQLPSGAAVTNFSLATNRVWKDKNGAKQEDSQFHNIVVFGQQASNCAQYLKKGATALVEGRMQTRSWDAQDGSKKYRTEIIAERVQFGPRVGGGGESSYNKNDSNNKGTDDNQSGNSSGDGIDYPEEEINPEDIPF